jgi:type I restriction enzyme S subunit
VLRIPNIAHGRIDLADLKYATVSFQLDDESALNPGDMLICRTNGSIQLIGKTAIVREPLTQRHTFASYLLRFRFDTSKVRPAWVHLYLSSEAGRRFIEANAASSAGQHNISLNLLHRMPIPLPPVNRQAEIVAEVDAQLSAVEEMDGTVEANLKRAVRLRQAILKRAFEGKLASPDATDEPAIVLLERIRVERATSNGTARQPRRSSTRVDRASKTIQEPLPL